MAGLSGWFSMCAGMIVAVVLAVSPVFAQSVIPSFGGGSCEIRVYTDYFCPPCKRTDTKAESLIKDLLSTGKVRITFIDVPFNRATPMYARYYLYAANAVPDANQVLKVRRLLFEAAQDKRILTEDALADYLKKNKIDLKQMDEKPVFSLMNGAIKEAQIDQTPTWIVRCAPGDEKKCIGEEQILSELARLKKKLAKVKK